MNVCKRLLAALTFLVSAAMLLLSLAAGVGVWIVKGPATAKASHVFERIEAALDIADQGLDHVKTSLTRATERLDTVREEQRRLAGEPQTLAAARRLLARTVQQRVAPEISNAHEKLHTVAEAAVVVNSVLDDVGNFPFLSVTGIDVDQLRDINTGLSRVATSAWDLSRQFAEQPTASDPDAATQLSRVERALKALQGSVADYEPRLREVRKRTEDLKARTFPWITPAASVISAVCFWIALSQISLLCHARSWWAKCPRNTNPPGIRP